MPNLIAELIAKAVDLAVQEMEASLGYPVTSEARRKALRAVQAHLEAAVEAEVGRHRLAERDRYLHPPIT